MFEDLRSAFREAIDNFNAELRRDQVPETVDRLLRGMTRELTDAKALVKELESQLEKARASGEAERLEAETCVRREDLARKIGDVETADVALRFAQKHLARQRLVQQKADALAEELDFRRKELDEMFSAFHEARSRKDSLSSTAGRSEARQTLSAADELFRELDRMADRIQGEHAQGEAAEALGDIDLESDFVSEYRVDLDEPPPREEVDVDAALAELKRRMGRE